MIFKKLGLIEPLLLAINELGYKEPTPVQKRVIPLALQKKDIFATAQTGTGKTAAFALPILQKIRKKDHKNPKALILTPTRELCLQIDNDIKNYAKYLHVKSIALVSGKDINKQRKQIRSGIDIIVATPGRFSELMEQKLNLKEIDFFILDEADRMLDMGFSKDIKQIYPNLPKKRQTMLFSATLNEKVRKMSKLVLKKPAFVETAKQNTTAINIEETVYALDTDQKASACAYLIGSKNLHQVLVFTKTKQSADFLVEELNKDGLKSGVIHGDKTKANRNKTLLQFKEGKLRVLVATDIASRGLDIKDLPCVINYELPTLPQDYVHRVGRTGRAGKSGEAISFVDRDEKMLLKKIEKLTGKKIQKNTLDGFQPKQRVF